MRSKLHMSRLSCVQSYIWPDYRAFKIAYVQTIVHSKLHMSRLSCVQNCICPDYRAFKISYVQTIVRSFFSRPCNFERTTPPCAFISVWTYRLSVWDLNLGCSPVVSLNNLAGGCRKNSKFSVTAVKSTNFISSCHDIKLSRVRNRTENFTPEELIIWCCCFLLLYISF